VPVQVIRFGPPKLSELMGRKKKLTADFSVLMTGEVADEL